MKELAKMCRFYNDFCKIHNVARPQTAQGNSYWWATENKETSSDWLKGVRGCLGYI